jgi:hypothetical protein
VPCGLDFEVQVKVIDRHFVLCPDCATVDVVQVHRSAHFVSTSGGSRKEDGCVPERSAKPRHASVNIGDLRIQGGAVGMLVERTTVDVASFESSDCRNSIVAVEADLDIKRAIVR